MTDDWANDLIAGGSDEDDGSADSETTDSGGSMFEDSLRKMLEMGNQESIDLGTIESKVDQVEDVELLGEAAEADTRQEAEQNYRQRIENLKDEGGDSGNGPSEAEPGDSSDKEEGDGDPAEPTIVSASELDDESGDDEESESTEADDASEEVPAPSGAEAEPEEVADAGDDEAPADSSGSSDLPDVDVGSIAPMAVDREDALNTENNRTVLVWGGEGTGKTHFVHTAPPPIAVIDTEGKADEIADKFDKPVYYFPVGHYDELVDARDQALDLLAEFYGEGHRGTLAVDSMSQVWEMAQQKYQEIRYPEADGPEDVDFKSALQGEDDWKVIKRYHNTNFREVILDSPYNVVLTAGKQEDYDYDGENFDSRWVPSGEKWNRYATKTVVRLRREDGETVADLRKSARTAYSFRGLSWPEWDDVYELVGEIAEAEKSGARIEGYSETWDVLIQKGHPVPKDGGEDDDE